MTKQFIQRLLLLPLLLIAFLAKGQTANMEIYGPTTVKQGQVAIYSAVLHAYDPNNPKPDYCWTVSGGTYRVINDGCKKPGEPAKICEKCTTIEVTWGQGGGSWNNISVSTENGYNATLNVLVVTPITLPAIQPASQQVKYNTAGTAFVQPTPGGGDGTFTYQWQRLNSKLDWEDVSGATAGSFTPPAHTQSTSYRIKVSSYGATVFSRPVEVLVRRELQAGEIIGFQQVMANAPVAVIRGEPASGEEGRFAYQWQQSADKSNWTDISGATGVYYTPPATASTKYYRRKVTSTFGTATTVVYSNISTVMVGGSAVQNTPNNSTASYTQPLRQQTNLAAGISSYTTSSYKEWNVQKSGVKTVEEVTALPVGDVYATRHWFDGLGRPIQTIDIQSTTRAKDVVQQYSYDELGRERDRYLPYVDSTAVGTFRVNAGSAQQQYYKTHYPAENFFLDHTIYDGVGREATTAGPGNTWAGNNAGHQEVMRMPQADEKIYKWILANDSTPGLQELSTRFWDTRELMVTESRDVYGRQILSYYDRQGRAIMEKQQEDESGNNWIISYKVYDDFNRVRFVITPKVIRWMANNSTSVGSAAWSLPFDLKYSLCFSFQFDDRGRLTSRKDPGVGATEIVYDKQLRPLLSRTILQREKGQWDYFVYDREGRVIVNGIFNNTESRDVLQGRVDQQSAGAGSLLSVTEPAPVDLELTKFDGTTMVTAKSSVSLLSGYESPDNAVMEFSVNPSLQDNVILSQVLTDQDYLGLINNSNCTPLRYNYYDHYNFPDAAAKGFNGTYAGKLAGGSPGLPATRSAMTEGMLTGIKVKVIYPDGVSGPQWLNTVLYYDDQNRLLQTNSDNVLGGTDVESFQYNYTGGIVSSHLYHTNPWAKPMKSMEILKRYLYYANGRPYQTWMKVNNDAEKLLETNSYNDFGRLEKKVLGNQLETLDYSYNVKGWLTGINKDYATSKSGQHFFGEYTSYDEGFATARLDGYATGTVWRRAGAPNASMAYGFRYDAAGRLTDAYFTQNKDGAWSQAEKNYTVDNMVYDANGNLLSMRRKASFLGGTTTVDDLTYTYEDNGDRLKKIKDIGGDNKQNDFKQGNTGSGPDYLYASDGSLITDANKKLALNWNSYLAKPDKLVFENDQNKVIRYVYDAMGNRLQKVIKEGNLNTSYSYIGDFIYKNDTSMVQYLHEAGRMRGVKQTLSGAYALVLDYYIVDRQGNVRTVITEEKDTAIYRATFETVRDGVETATFSNRTETRENIPAVYPFYNSGTNQYWSRLNSTDPARRIGASIVLKVMAGDQIDVGTRAYYKQQSSSSAGTTANDMVRALTSVLLGPAATVVDNGHGNLMQGNDRVLNTTDISGFITQRQQENSAPSTNPKAYLTYVLFDEDFKMVSGNVLRIDKGPDALQDYAGSLNVPQNGFLYVYVSNESPVDVWFDDITVMHRTGPLLQESTVYPYGLEIASQSSRSLMKAANEAFYQGKELDEELGLTFNYFDARYYDPQTGRFISMDPRMQLVNGYMGMGGNPAMFVDPDGRFAWVLIPIIIGAVYNVVSNLDAIGPAFKEGFWSGIGKAAGFAAVGAVSGAISFYVKDPVIGNALSSAVTNFGNTWLRGGSLEDMGKSALVGATTGVVTGFLSKGSDKISKVVLDKIGGGGKTVISKAIAKFGSSLVSNLPTSFAGAALSQWLSGEPINWQKAFKDGAIGALGVALVDGGVEFAKLKQAAELASKKPEGPSVNTDIKPVPTQQVQTNQVPVPSVTAPKPMTIPSVQPSVPNIKAQNMVNRLKSLPQPTLKRMPLQ